MIRESTAPEAPVSGAMVHSSTDAPRHSFAFRDLACLLLLVVGWCGCTSLGPTTSPRLTSSEKMMWSTYAIATTRGMATCLVVNRKDSSAPGGVVPVIVTSAHILRGAPKGPFYIVIRSPRADRNPEIGILEFRAQDSRVQPFVKHPRQDLAALELRIPAEFARDVTLPSFVNESAIGRRGSEPHAGKETSVLGFPHVFPGTQGGFPLLRGGTIASYAVGSDSDREKFLLNTNVYGGDSGGPVFTRSGRGTPVLLGIVTERIGEKEGEYPLAVAVSAAVVRETLQLQAAQEQSIEARALLPSPAASRSGAQLFGRFKSFREILRANKHMRPTWRVMLQN